MIFLTTLMFILEILELYVTEDSYLIMKKLKLDIRAYSLFFIKGYIKCPGIFEIFCKIIFKIIFLIKIIK